MHVNKNISLKNILNNKVVKKFLKENNLLKELSKKSLFMIDNNNLKIDIDGDGKYDKKINCIFDQQGDITQCNNLTDIDNSQENIVNILNTWLQAKFGDKKLGFNFGNTFVNNNSNLKPVETTNTRATTNYEYQLKENIEEPKTNSFNAAGLKKQIENLNIDGIKIELVNNYKPNSNQY